MTRDETKTIYIIPLVLINLMNSTAICHGVEHYTELKLISHSHTMHAQHINGGLNSKSVEIVLLHYMSSQLFHGR